MPLPFLASTVVDTTSYGATVLRSQRDRILDALPGTRNNTVFAAACKVGKYAASQGIAETQAFELLVAAAEARGVTHSEARRQIRNGLAKGRLDPRDAGPNWKGTGCREARDLVVATLQDILASDAKAGTKRLALVLAFELYRFGRRETTQSYRQLAELAGVSASTAWNHRKHLARWFRHIGGETIDLAGTWRLIPVGHPVDLSNVKFPDPSNNYWYRKPGEWLAFCWVYGGDEVTFEELAALAGRALRTVKGYVKRWVEAGLAVVSDGAVKAVKGAALPVTAIDYAERRRVRHDGERWTWSRWLRALVARREHEATLTREEREALEAKRKAEREARDEAARAAGRRPRHLRLAGLPSGKSLKTTPERPQSSVYGEYPAAA